MSRRSAPTFNGWFAVSIDIGSLEMDVLSWIGDVEEQAKSKLMGKLIIIQRKSPFIRMEICIFECVYIDQN